MFLESPLRIGNIFAIFSVSGKIPLDIQLLKSSDNSGAIMWAVIFITYPGIPSGPVAFLLLISLIILEICSLLVGYKYIDCIGDLLM